MSVDNKDNEKAILTSNIEEIKMTDKDLNAQFNVRSTAFNSKALNPYSTHFMPATNQYGSALYDFFGDGSGYTGFNFTDKEFTIIQRYLQYRDILSDVYNYDNWPDEFKFTYHDLEQKLNEDGTIAIVRIPQPDGKNWFFLCSYSVEKWNYLNKPKEIKPVFDDRQKVSWKNKTFKNNYEDESQNEFKIINNNISQMGLLPRILRYLILWEASTYGLEKQGRLLNPKVFYNGDIEVRRAKLKNAMEDVMNDEDTFQEIFLHKDTGKKSDLLNSEKFQDSIDKLFATIQFEPRIDDYKTLINMSKDYINETIGLATNPLSDKAERTNTMEINTQQDLSQFTSKHAFMMRKEALDKVNEWWGMDIEISQDSTAYEDAIDNTDTGNVDRIMNGGEDDEKN